MTYGSTPWPPRVGQRIQVVATGEFGTVVKVQSSGGGQQFVVALDSVRARDVDPKGIGVGSDPDAAPVRVCALDEIEPSTS